LHSCGELCQAQAQLIRNSARSAERSRPSLLAKLLAGPASAWTGHFRMLIAGVLTELAFGAAIKAAMDAGMGVDHVEFEKGKVTIFARKSGELISQVFENPNPWDEVMKDAAE
jgi:hypothetical protein